MAHETPSDDEIMAADRRFYRNIWLGVLFALPVMGVCGVLLAMATDKGALPAPMARNPLLDCFAIAAILVLPFMIWIWPPKEVRLVRIRRRMIETHLRRMRLAVIYNIFSQPFMCALLLYEKHFSGSGLDARKMTPHGWLLPGMFLLTAAAQTALLLAGKQFLDELTREQWADAARLGFAVAIAGIGLLFVIAIARPGWMVPVSALAITVALVAPQIYFLILDRRARRLAEGD